MNVSAPQVVIVDGDRYLEVRVRGVNKGELVRAPGQHKPHPNVELICTYHTRRGGYPVYLKGGPLIVVVIFYIPVGLDHVATTLQFNGTTAHAVKELVWC